MAACVGKNYFGEWRSIKNGTREACFSIRMKRVGKHFAEWFRRWGLMSNIEDLVSAEPRRVRRFEATNAAHAVRRNRARHQASIPHHLDVSFRAPEFSGTIRFRCITRYLSVL